MSATKNLAWISLVALLVAAGCSESTEQTRKPSGDEGAASAAKLPADLFVATAPADAKGVEAAKQSAEVGRDVVIHGRIGGRRDPFVTGRAVFMLADMVMPTCREKHGDGCPTPWDYCCEPKERVLANTATVQVVGDDGRPLKIDLDGQNGLEPMAEVVVAGKVSMCDENGAVVVDARVIHVKTQ